MGHTQKYLTRYIDSKTRAPNVGAPIIDRRNNKHIWGVIFPHLCLYQRCLPRGTRTIMYPHLNAFQSWELRGYEHVDKIAPIDIAHFRVFSRLEADGYMAYGGWKHRNKGNEKVIEIDWAIGQDGAFDGLQMDKVVELERLYKGDYAI